MRSRSAVMIGAAAVAAMLAAYLLGAQLAERSRSAAAAKGSEIRVDFNRMPAGTLALGGSALSDGGDGEIETLVSHPMLFIDGRVNVAKASATAAVQASYKKIRAYMSAHHLAAAGPPIAINEDFDTAHQVWIYRAAIPLAAPPAAPPAPGEGVSLGKSYGGMAARFVHVGDPSQAQPTYAKIEIWMRAKQFTASGPSWEEYESDPGSPLSRWRTNIYVPLG